jgi:hypothetical protein
MTVASNYCVYNYKQKRHSSIKKDYNKKINKLNTINYKNTINIINILISRVNIVKTKRKIIVMGKEYIIKLPNNYDIYEGLRLWYPKLYKKVLIEEEIEKNNYYNEEIQYDNYEENEEEENYEIDEEEAEKAWAYYDYLEWKYD